MKSERCAVVIKNSWETDMMVYQLSNYEKACAFLRWKWQEYYNDEIAEHSQLYEVECWCEENEAKITWGDGKYTSFIITGFITPDRGFNIYYKKITT